MGKAGLHSVYHRSPNYQSGGGQHRAFFSLACLNVLDARPMRTELTEYELAGKIKHAVQRPTVLILLAAIMDPMIKSIKPQVMCHVRSCRRRW